MKKQYIKPKIELIDVKCNNLLSFSYDNTGNSGLDGESGFIIEGDLDSEDEVG